MKHSLLLPIAFMLMAFCAQAQTDYQLSSFDAPFEELSGATIYDVEDWIFPEISIAVDFPFMLGSESITSLTQMGFGFEWVMHNEVSSNVNVLGAFLFLASSSVLADPGAPSMISWLTEGETGNRILKIEYLDVAFVPEISSMGTAINRMSAQLWLYESDNSIEYRFGPSNIVNPEFAYEFHQGPILFMLSNLNQSSGDVETGFYLSGDPANPELVPVSTYGEFSAALLSSSGDGTPLTGTPADGQVYRLEPMSLSVSDEVQTGFKLYPTIAEQEIILSGIPSGVENYNIINVSGATVQTGVLENNRVNVSELASGMYLIQVDGGLKAEKFFKR